MLPQLQLYNSLTHTKEPFIPLLAEGKADKVGMYSCGPTVYSTPSIGNYRAFFTADLIRNLLQELYAYAVCSVMNITDVGHLTSDGDTGEDKLEKGAKKDGITAREVAKKYETEFLEGLAQLHIKPFDHMPRATDHIAEQQALVQKLIDKGYTYLIAGDGIYMDTSKVADYGEIMGPNYKKRLEHLNAGERVEMNGKKHPTDFALRKFSPQGETRQMEWEFAPYGRGFPGWHIECSAMSSKYLGQQFDIHHGGADHTTVHHPNEIAQSEAAFELQRPERRVKYRLHNEFLQVDGGKMSKSLGNVYTLQDLKTQGYSPIDLRFFFFMAQYRSFQNFTWEALAQAQKTRENLKKKLHALSQPTETPFSKEENADFIKLAACLADDFNTPKFLSTLNALLANPQAETKAIIKRYDDHILKCDLFSSEHTTLDQEIPVEILTLAQERVQAKQSKNYALADELRSQIQAAGFEIKDLPSGFTLSKK